MNEIKHFRFRANYSTEWPLKKPVGWVRLALMGKYHYKKVKKSSGKKTQWWPLIIFCLLLLVATYPVSGIEPWCCFWGRYFLRLIIWPNNMVLLPWKSLKSLYEDLWGPLIFNDPKFLEIFIKILKRFLKAFGLFISVKKLSLQYLWNIFKNLQKGLLLLKTFQNLGRSLNIYILNISNLGRIRENVLIYTKKLL